MRTTFKVLLSASVLVATPLLADDIGGGKPNTGPDTTPPEPTAESCASTLECAWQELLDIFEMHAE